jgi:hypothetical protein
MSDLREAALQFFAALDSLNIPFAIGGSFASSIHGIARPTQDIDVVAKISPAQIVPLAQALQSAFYADPDQMRSAIFRRRSFNVIHLATSFKFDVFPASSHPLGDQQIDRRQFPTGTILGGDPITLPVVSAEDILLAKLRWYRDGGESSERQWNDLRNILAVQAGRLDRDYLRHWAAILSVSDLLEKLLPPFTAPPANK